MQSVEPRKLFRWRRLDVAGLEILTLTTGADGVLVLGHCIDAGEDPFHVRHEWLLDAHWRSRSVRLTVTQDIDRHLQIERVGATSWRVNGCDRPDLDGCEEVDLSFTPVCNGIALRRTKLDLNESFELMALYVRLPDLFIAPSRQKYRRTGDAAYRYIDLGVSAGFEAALQVDEDLVVLKYEGLFERT